MGVCQKSTHFKWSAHCLEVNHDLQWNTLTLHGSPYLNGEPRSLNY